MNKKILNVLWYITKMFRILFFVLTFEWDKAITKSLNKTDLKSKKKSE